MSANINIPITHLGRFAPIWLPDAEAPNCMQCETRFTFTKRRHHCRACGKVFCSTCCNLKSRLGHLNGKEARVCSRCYQDLVRAQVFERMHAESANGETSQPQVSPNPNNPSEYCSTIPPMQQVQANAPPPTVMVPSTVGVLRKQGSIKRNEPKQVMFSDGIRPGGDLTELDGSSDVPTRLPSQRTGRKVKVVERSSEENTAMKTRTVKSPEATRHTCLIPETGLPPVILQTGVKGDYSIEENPDSEKIMAQIESTEDVTPVVFAINKNLFVIVKIVSLECCVNRVCWNFTTKGMCTVNQAEIMFVLECLPQEKTIPRDIFTHLNSVYEDASRGNPVSNLSHVIFTRPFLDSRDHGGVLYMQPTFQCQQKLILPSPPYLYGILLQKWETPWAKVFPLRLMLRLGAEFRYYPCPLISVRFRKPVYGEIGHTIMNLLADFRNYQYMLPTIKGVTVHMEDKWTYVNFPRNRYDQVMKVVNSSNDHVMALGANFSSEADSHLICYQNDEGTYQTQAINIQNKPRQVTGASFVVFNGALKTSAGMRAKSSIVEDGVMVQVTAESLAAMKDAMKEMHDYTIPCGSFDLPQPDEHVKVQWVDDDKRVNIGVVSPIDGTSMEGIQSIHIHHATDYAGEKRAIRWTECFFMKNEDQSNPRFEPVDQSRLAETLAQACCIALTKHLDPLKEAGLAKIALRATIDAEQVGYEVGSNGQRLPDFCMNDLDNELIAVIHNAASHTQDAPVLLELVFHIVE
ncbi:hypothetical protein CAPTEDRAFT_178790 [Capitella teleta]|uniref:FYVE-type domain-containing protein n=1 Tax=Capitella teleta TaxID=283909 RepID=R7U380_CAPTE|nr:hypothetical protein CAPTEDRAFT_178790 [Capitella teleta]|eukprot:ELT98136.1 hypothetical protein CAPTEDRAFT_178790 [Capitella teleta]